MKNGKPTKKLWPAFLASQSQVESIRKTGLNPHFRSSYITLDSIIGGPLKTFNNNGILITQVPSIEDGAIALTTVVCHAESGENFTTETRFPADTSDIQKVGSAITYARRYALTSILALGAEDDDGNGAAPRTTRPRVTNQVTHPRRNPVDLGL